LDSNSIIAHAGGDEYAQLAFLVVRLATLLSIPQLETVLAWTGISPEWRAVFETHLGWANAAKRGIVDGGDCG
jgi:hypothetical protein